MLADLYADSSFLFSLFTKDSQSAAASAYMARAGAPLVFNPLHRMEVRNALRNAAGRDEITAQDCRAAFRVMDDDKQAGLIVHTPIAWADVFRRADELSEQHAAAQGQRSIDLLHVALALETGATTFLSFDNRQRKLAQAAGLKVKP